jgi:hypothetical protein
MKRTDDVSGPTSFHNPWEWEAHIEEHNRIMEEAKAAAAAAMASYKPPGLLSRVRKSIWEWQFGLRERLAVFLADRDGKKGKNWSESYRKYGRKLGLWS